MAKNKWTPSRIIQLGLGLTASLFVLLTGLASVSQWDWNDSFKLVILFLVSGYLLIEAGIKNVAGVKQATKSQRGLVHLGSFMFGILLLYIAITSLPNVGAMNLPSLEKFNGWIMLFSGIFAVLEGFVK